MKRSSSAVADLSILVGLGGLPADRLRDRPRPCPSPLAMAARPPCRPILITHAIQFSSIRRCETRLPMKRAAITRSSLVPPARRAARADARPAAFFYPRPLHGARLDGVPPVLFSLCTTQQWSNGSRSLLPPVRRRLTFSDYMRADGADRKLKECFGDPSSQRKGGK